MNNSRSRRRSPQATPELLRVQRVMGTPREACPALRWALRLGGPCARARGATRQERRELNVDIWVDPAHLMGVEAVKYFFLIPLALLGSTAAFPSPPFNSAPAGCRLIPAGPVLGRGRSGSCARRTVVRSRSFVGSTSTVAGQPVAFASVTRTRSKAQSPAGHETAGLSDGSADRPLSCRARMISARPDRAGRGCSGAERCLETDLRRGS